MWIENPAFADVYNILIRESHQLAHQIGGDPEVIDGYALKLLNTVLDAVDRGLSRGDIETALKQGLHQGELQCADPSLTPEYWEEVRQEIEGE